MPVIAGYMLGTLQIFLGGMGLKDICEGMRDEIRIHVMWDSLRGACSQVLAAGKEPWLMLGDQGSRSRVRFLPFRVPGCRAQRFSAGLMYLDVDVPRPRPSTNFQHWSLARTERAHWLWICACGRSG